MPLPPPPAELARPNTTPLPRGTRLHRVHLATYPGAAFNPCRGGPTRFAPITDAGGACVPSLYAGSTREAAIFETIFHDVPASPGLKTVPLSAVHARAHSEIELRRTLTFANLRAPDLKLWGIERADLVAAPPTRYAETARWAEALHRQVPDIDGLIWTSNRCDPADALILFGDRVGPGDLASIETTPGTDPAFVAAVCEAGARAGITLTL